MIKVSGLWCGHRANLATPLAVGVPSCHRISCLWAEPSPLWRAVAPWWLKRLMWPDFGWQLTNWLTDKTNEPLLPLTVFTRVTWADQFISVQGVVFLENIGSFHTQYRLMTPRTNIQSVTFFCNGKSLQWTISWCTCWCELREILTPWSDTFCDFRLDQRNAGHMINLRRGNSLTEVTVLTWSLGNYVKWKTTKTTNLNNILCVSNATVFPTWFPTFDKGPYGIGRHLECRTKTLKQLT